MEMKNVNLIKNFGTCATLVSEEMYLKLMSDSLAKAEKIEVKEFPTYIVYAYEIKEDNSTTIHIEPMWTMSEKEFDAMLQDKGFGKIYYVKKLS